MKHRYLLWLAVALIGTQPQPIPAKKRRHGK